VGIAVFYCCYSLLNRLFYIFPLEKKEQREKNKCPNKKLFLEVLLDLD
jgi:hypothetical protein